MSGSSGAPPPGVVQSSALSFVASAQPTTADGAPGPSAPDRDLSQADRLMPAGLKALCEACSRLYPDQPNPLQVTTRLKYWLGGQDPLDYISMYWNPGKPEEHIPPHWHYVSFGLSDLHGDGRVHPTGSGGYGFELTLRLAADGPQPPLWPAALLQALARYVFTTGNKFSCGDHVSWHRALDGGGSRLRHLLVAAEPELAPCTTPHGAVGFLQVVGCTARELKAAQRGSGFEVLKLISEDPNCGGSWLVTKVNRRVSAKGVSARYNGNARAELAGVCCRVRWTGTAQTNTDEIKHSLERDLTRISVDASQPQGHMSTDSFEMSTLERALPQLSDNMEGSWRGDNPVEYLESVHIIMNAEGASLLPLAIEGRVAHGSTFTWRECGTSVTLAPSSVVGRTHTATGGQLQVSIPPDLATEMSSQLWSLHKLGASDSECESDDEQPPPLPTTFNFDEHAVKITVTSDSDFL